MASRTKLQLTLEGTGNTSSTVEAVLIQLGAYRIEAISAKVVSGTGTVTGFRCALLDRAEDLTTLGASTIADTTETDQVFRIDDGSGGFVTGWTGDTIVDSPITSHPTAYSKSTLIYDVQGSGAWVIDLWVSAKQE